MSRVFLCIVVVSLAVIAPELSAKEISIDELRAIQSKLKSSEYLSVEFVQSNYTAMRKKTRKREGRAYFAKSGKFKWMLETPAKEYKIYDGKDFFDYDPVAKSAMRFSPTGPQSYQLREVVDLVLNFDTLLKRYDLKKADQEGDLVKIEIKPKTDAEIVSVDLHFDTKGATITFLKLNMKNGNYLAHDFKSPSRAELTAETFGVPAGVKISDSK